MSALDAFLFGFMGALAGLTLFLMLTDYYERFYEDKPKRKRKD